MLAAAWSFACFGLMIEHCVQRKGGAYGVIHFMSEALYSSTSGHGHVTVAVQGLLLDPFQ